MKIEDTFLPACICCPDRRGLLYVDSLRELGTRDLTKTQQKKQDDWYESNGGEYYITTAAYRGEQIPICSTCMAFLEKRDMLELFYAYTDKIIPARRTYHGPYKNRK